MSLQWKLKELADKLDVSVCQVKNMLSKHTPERFSTTPCTDDTPYEEEVIQESVDELKYIIQQWEDTNQGEDYS